MKSNTTGTGVIVDTNGLIVTNCHVVKDVDVVGIKFPEELSKSDIFAEIVDSNELVDQVLGRVVYTEPQLDLALIRVPHVKSGALTACNMEDNRWPTAGQEVICVGNPDSGDSVVTGVISSVEKMPSIDAYNCLANFDHKYINNTTPTSRGFSGGPLVNSDGHLIGIHFSGGLNSGSHAIHVNDVKDFIIRGKEFEEEVGKKCYSFANRKALGVVLNRMDSGFRVCKFTKNNPLDNEM
ncbi:unnamed protein product [Medioppia subpectinata]|uniref:Serine protease n=1 Tax=Medioppia subpectinata TaxID=1979941 RepID=A0A7R9L188_9ACAR|nr:unnamed protein product [Medioppia subpectinata]CAG2113721.1 unnamed protein product [Medioppia subpectinata]